MTHLSLFLATAAPSTPGWSPTVGITMILCNIIAIAIGKYTIQKQNSGPQLPSPELFGGMGLPALLGTTSLGHLIGAGVILGLANVGAL